MSFDPPRWTKLLLARGILTEEQLDEAMQIVDKTGNRLPNVLSRRYLISARQIASVQAETLGIPYLDLREIYIPSAVLECLPESVARENLILPIAHMPSLMILATMDPDNPDLLQKLQFILNCQIRFVLATREDLLEAINRHYGQTETESVDSCLMEFTDTAVELSWSDSEEDDDFDEEALPAVALAAPGAAGETVRYRRESAPTVERRASVRYYERMHPERMHPLFVVISKKQLQEVVKKHVKQAEGQAFQVKLDSLIEVEPILPGCTCYPPKDQLRITSAESTATFWVVPQVLGKVMHARVMVRQEGRVLAEIPVEIRVSRQTLSMLCGLLSLGLPLMMMVMKQMRLDLESQMEDGFGLYAGLLHWILSSLSPEIVGGTCLLAAAGLYLWMRPRPRDVFWDLDFRDPEPSAEPEIESAPTSGDKQSGLLAAADAGYEAGDWANAYSRYVRALELKPTPMRVYHRAALCAHRLGKTDVALAILKSAKEQLPPEAMKGVLWFNMACYAARLGKPEEALTYLQCAVERGYRDRAKMLTDEDLASLRWREPFKRLVASLA